MSRFLYVAFSIILLNLLVQGIDSAMATVCSFIFPILFLLFLQRIDVFEREKFKDIFFVFIFGFVISVILCIPYVILRESFFVATSKINLVAGFISVALPEEIIKIIPFIFVLKYRKFVDEPIDYLIYASASALGFVFMENIGYILDYNDSGSIVALRSTLPAIMHMLSSSVFAFGIFLYVNSKKTKFIFYGLIFAALSHAVYNWSWNFGGLIGSIVLIFLCIYYSKLIQSLLNISPFYDKSKENEIHTSSNFLLYVLIGVLATSSIYDIYSSASVNLYWMLIIPFAIYRIISSKLSLKQDNFIALGTRKTKFKLIIEMQNIIINFYKNNRNK
tara:strand:+ start:261 stop:1259 length:999 start_codon:yes stop_codon:yes gene_type:complete